MTNPTERLRFEDIKPCAKCGGSILPMLYRVNVEALVFDMGKIQQLTGLVGMLHGSAKLAGVFSPHTNYANLFEEKSALICVQCAMTMTVGEFMECVGKSHD